GFDHTVLVNMRARLRDSADPDRIFRVSKEVAADAGLIGVKRVLDSTPLYDAVATQDTVTLIRGAIRGLLRVCDDALAAEIRRFQGVVADPEQRSEEHTSELQSRGHLVCRLLLEKKKTT